MFISILWPDGKLSAKCTCYIFRTKAMGKLCDTIRINAAINAWVRYVFDFELIIGCGIHQNVLYLQVFHDTSPSIQ